MNKQREVKNMRSGITRCVLCGTSCRPVEYRYDKEILYMGDICKPCLGKL